MQNHHAPASAFPDRSTGFAGDPLSDVLDKVRLTGALFFLVDASSPWCVNVPHAKAYKHFLAPPLRHVLSYHVVLQGRGHASVPGRDAVPFQAGDIVMFPHGHAYRMESMPDTPPEFDHDQMIAFFQSLAAGQLPFTVSEGGGGEPKAKFACGFLSCDNAPFNPLLMALPDMIVIRTGGPRDDRLARLVDITLAEFGSDLPGGACMRLDLSELIFIEALRRHLQADGSQLRGWLGALNDPAVGKAMSLIHAAPEKAWTLSGLARDAALSRSVLSERFTTAVGMSPMRYLAQWRMQVAAQRLSESSETVAQIAYAIGYRSESAFSRAFRRCTSLSPGAWRRRKSALRS